MKGVPVLCHRFVVRMIMEHAKAGDDQGSLTLLQMEHAV